MAERFVVDFTRPPNDREAAALRKRLARLDAAANTVHASITHFQAMAAGRKPDTMLRYRSGYSVLAKPAEPGGSDRLLPPRTARPPVTRLPSPRGAALRFHLLALADAQFRGRPGQRTKNERPLRTPDSNHPGWSSLLASDAVRKGDGRTNLSATDKRVRQIQSSLDALKAARLVELPHFERGAGKYEEFELLEETAGSVSGEDPIPYRVPKVTEDHFAMPDEFVTKGWVHLLEDSEIALLLMVACARHSIEKDAVAIPAFHRVQHYGIGRDGFEAHHWLQRFGLLDVDAVGRHPDGRSEDFKDEGASLHRLSLLRDGFSRDAIDVVRGAIRGQLARVPKK